MQIKPKKSLGQNFLFDKNIQAKIISSCQLKPDDTVLEVGSGRGELTGLIAERVKRVLALEIDAGLCSLLRKNLKRYKNVKIINQDIMEFPLKRYLFKPRNKIKVIGNIPYYITSPIIELLLGTKDKIETIILTVQKEFAKRIVSNPGSKEYGSFSCFVQYHTKAKILFYVKNSCFFPRPKVDSAVLELSIQHAPTVRVEDEKLLFKIVRAAFNKRRKIMKNSLKDIIPQQKLELFFKKYYIDPKIRPEKLSLQDFANLTNV
ncbi:MAG: 16S rRNA (adenine(1518)-N(6)/adenine(1519)-N(6))-dimethyltransferase RsmA [Candidatus Omnitrophota bacterium]